MLQETSNNSTTSTKNIFLTSLISGALAGTFCDFVSYPLDTLKTRLQSQRGFLKSGGFKQLYKGLGPVMIGSAPSASLFFVTYEGIKLVLQPRIPEQYHSFVFMTAASIGEMGCVGMYSKLPESLVQIGKIRAYSGEYSSETFKRLAARSFRVACIIRVPVEVIKQRRQAFVSDSHKLPLRTLYRGYGSTVIRDLPFGFIQMPLWEYFKLYWKRHVNRECTPIEGALCGSLSVAISASLTTPLDVAKTRIMLSNMSAAKNEIKISVMLKEVYREKGFKGLFAGFLPRVGGFTLAGFVFFGVYEKVRMICISILS